MNFYEILKTKKLGRGSPDYWTQLFAEHVGGKGEWKISEITAMLPITFRSNGTALIDYRIFGTVDGAGVQTENLLPSAVASTMELNGITATCDGKGKYTITGTATKLTILYFSIPEFSFPLSKDSGGGGIIAFFNSNSYSDAAITFVINSGDRRSHYWALSTVNRVAQTWTLTSFDPHLDKIGFVISSGAATNLTIEPVVVDNGTEPTTHIPYGYKLPLKVTNGTESKDTDIYIGDSKLGEEEYVDYEEQKVYKRTENLFNFDEYDIGDTSFITKTLTLEPNTAYTMSSNAPLYNVGALIVLVAMGESASTSKNGVYKDRPITKTTDASGKIRIGLRDNGSGYDLSIYKTMLVKGSTPPETYIPYLQPTDPPLPLPEIETFKGTNILDSTETLGEVTIKGQIKPQS